MGECTNGRQSCFPGVRGPANFHRDLKKMQNLKRVQQGGNWGKRDKQNCRISEQGSPYLPSWPTLIVWTGKLLSGAEVAGSEPRVCFVRLMCLLLNASPGGQCKAGLRVSTGVLTVAP